MSEPVTIDLELAVLIAVTLRNYVPSQELPLIDPRLVEWIQKVAPVG